MDESIADVSSDAEGKSVGSQLVFYRCKTGCVCIEYVLYLGLSFNVFMRLQQIRNHIHLINSHFSYMSVMF